LFRGPGLGRCNVYRKLKPPHFVMFTRLLHTNCWSIQNDGVHNQNHRWLWWSLGSCARQKSSFEVGWSPIDNCPVCASLSEPRNLQKVLQSSITLIPNQLGQSRWSGMVCVHGVTTVHSCSVMMRLYWLVRSLLDLFLFVWLRYDSLQCIKRRSRAIAAFVR
jgi:hypothetical protein